jgi:hypothetical protein
VLRNLEAHLHGLIKQNVAKLDTFVLPRLEPLVEFDSAAMWFPSHPEVPNSRTGMTITLLTHLHEIELEVEFKSSDMGLKYQVSVQGVQRIVGHR